MSHAPDCDLEVYGSLPNANGVVCTCDQDDGDEPAALPEAPQAQNRVVLTGAAAQAYKALAVAVTALRRAQEQHAAALARFTEAVSG